MIAAVQQGSKLDKEVSNLANVAERASASGGTLEDVANAIAEPTNSTLDALTKETRTIPVRQLIEEYRRPSITNMRLNNSLISISRTPFNDVMPPFADVSSVLYKIAAVPTEEEMRLHVKNEVERNNRENRDRDRQKALDDLMNPKKREENTFDRIYKLVEEQFKVLEKAEKIAKVSSQAIAETRMPKGPLIAPMSQAVAANNQLGLVGGALPIVLIFRYTCAGISRTQLFKKLTTPIFSSRSR